MFGFPNFFDNRSSRTPRGNTFGFEDDFFNPLRSSRYETDPRRSMYTRPQTEQKQQSTHRPQGRAQPYEPVHDVRCDGCREYPIRGTLYKCSACRDFDFCEDCFKTTRHPHPFHKIETPEENVSHPSMKRSTPKEEQRIPQRQSAAHKKEKFDNKENIKPETKQQKNAAPQPKFQETKPRVVEPQIKTPAFSQTKPINVPFTFDKSNMVIIRDETNNKVVDVIYG